MYNRQRQQTQQTQHSQQHSQQQNQMRQFYRPSYINHYENQFKQSQKQHKMINNQNDFNISSHNQSELGNNFMSSQFSEPEVLDNYYHNQLQSSEIQSKPIQSYLNDNNHTQNNNIIQSDNYENHHEYINNKSMNNSLDRHRLNSQLNNNNKSIFFDNRLDMHYNDSSKEKRTLMNERLNSFKNFNHRQQANLNYNFNSQSIKEQDRDFFDFNKPVNTRLNNNNKIDEKMLSYQNLTKEFTKPINEMYQEQDEFIKRKMNSK